MARAQVSASVQQSPPSSGLLRAHRGLRERPTAPAWRRWFPGSGVQAQELEPAGSPSSQLLLQQHFGFGEGCE